MAGLLSRPSSWFLVVVALAGAAALVAFAWPRQADVRALTNVSVQELHAAARQGALVLDVREPFEFADGRVADSVLVPLATVASRASEFPQDEPVFVFCRSGNRSSAAAEALVAAGFSDVRNVLGGMLAWEAAGFPIAR